MTNKASAFPSIEPPYGQEPQGLFRYLVSASQRITKFLYELAQRANACLPSDGSEAMTGTLSGTSASFTGTVLAGGNPKFRAHQSVAQSIPTGAGTPLTFDVVDINPNSAVTITNSTKIKPNVSGYYRVYGHLSFTAQTIVAVFISKNGAHVDESTIENATVNSITVDVADIIFLNGSTDYIEVDAFQQSGSNLNTSPGTTLVYVTLEILP